MRTAGAAARADTPGVGTEAGGVAAPARAVPGRLPVPARLYLGLLPLAAAAVLAVAHRAGAGGWLSPEAGGAAPPPAGLVVGLVALGVVAQHFPVGLGPGRKQDVSVAVYFAAVLLLAPGPAATVTGGSLLLGEATLALRRDPVTGARRAGPRSALFNTSQFVLATGLSGLVAATAGPPVGDSLAPGPAHALALTAAAATLYLANTWAVAVMVALQRGRRPLAVWREGRRHDLPEAAGLFLVGAVGAWAAAHAPWLLLPALAGAALVRRAFGRQAALARREAEFGRREAALARREAAAAAGRELGRLKDEFLGTVSHELRTPLTLVYGYAELLQTRLRRPGPAADPAGAAMAERVLASARLLARMVDDLLDFAHLERGAPAVHPQEIDLTPVLRDAVAGFGRQAGAGRLTAELPAALPARADPARVVQVATNLVANALKYAPAGPIALRAGPAPGDAGGAVRVEVQDCGPGIPPAEQPRVWEKFYRGAAVAGGTAPGVGIGLAVVKAVVEAQGGRVGLESAPGRGCRFWFELPGAAPSVAQPPSPPPRSSSVA